MEPVALLAELQALADDAPDFGTYSPASRSHLEWLGKAHALIARWNTLEAISFAHSADMLSVDAVRDMSVAAVVGMLHRAIASVRLQVPSHSNQAFGPGAVYDFYKALRELLASAMRSVFVVDPYLDEQVFETYLASVPQGVAVRLLTREHSTTLRPAVTKFVAQTRMSIEVRTSKALHDRVVFLDGRSCWVLGQSIKDAAKSKPTYLAPLAPDSASLKMTDYEMIWAQSLQI